MEDDLSPYFRHLKALGFIETADVPDRRAIQDANGDGLFILAKKKTQKTKKRFPFRLQLFRSHLSRAQIDFILQLASREDVHYFVFAPSLGAETAKLFDDADVNFVDLAGNCRVRLGDEFFARVEGRRAERPAPRERELRPPSLQVLFALLARAETLNLPVRSVSAIAGGVSPQTVSDVKKRLLAEDWIFEGKNGFEWTPKGRARALDALSASSDRLLAHLELGRFRSVLRPRELEVELEKRLKGRDFWWGGGAAVSRKDGFYRGTQTVVYLEPPLPEARGLLLPDARDDVIFRRLPGTVAVDERGEVAPLLVYLDLLAEAEPRAHEAADEIRDRFLSGTKQ